MHAAEPGVSAYCPGEHGTAVAFVDPAGQKYPTAHGPLQVLFTFPALLPKLPASHGPLHVDDCKPAAAPYRPGGHWLHDALLPTLYVPGWQIDWVADVEPGGHA